MSEFNFAKKRLEEIYQDLESKAFFDVDTTIALIEELEKLWLGHQPDATVQPGILFNEDSSLPGKSCGDLIECARGLRSEQIQHLPAFTEIFELRASLYRYQSM
ncbi:hypothetical protein [Sporomusa sp.]|jgi:hypothetical protein|uniref:hypothetical protein n=1 Tax=Sporomusa sp. TaxID=2078658 RepID=UPI002BA79E31|nr:hypothetical protein [Sporomusa sp.]MDF2874975.1 hypothetical protein [Sporomusa sp.]HWR06700.1 hypothetical protein [Sporomusa sp.]